MSHRSFPTHPPRLTLLSPWLLHLLSLSRLSAPLIHCCDALSLLPSHHLSLLCRPVCSGGTLFLAPSAAQPQPLPTLGHPQVSAGWGLPLLSPLAVASLSLSDHRALLQTCQVWEEQGEAIRNTGIRWEKDIFLVARKALPLLGLPCITLLQMNLKVQGVSVAIYVLAAPLSVRARSVGETCQLTTLHSQKTKVHPVSTLKPLDHSK